MLAHFNLGVVDCQPVNSHVLLQLLAVVHGIPQRYYCQAVEPKVTRSVVSYAQRGLQLAYIQAHARVPDLMPVLGGLLNVISAHTVADDQTRNAVEEEGAHSGYLIGDHPIQRNGG